MAGQLATDAFRCGRTQVENEDRRKREVAEEAVQIEELHKVWAADNAKAEAEIAARLEQVGALPSHRGASLLDSTALWLGLGAATGYTLLREEIANTAQRFFSIGTNGRTEGMCANQACQGVQRPFLFAIRPVPGVAATNSS